MHRIRPAAFLLVPLLVGACGDPHDSGHAHEPEAQLLSAEDVDQDVVSLSEALEEQRVERIARNVLQRPEVQQMLDRLRATGMYASDEEVIVRALRTLLAAVSPE